MKNTANELAIYAIQMSDLMYRNSPRNSSEGLKSLARPSSSETTKVVPAGNVTPRVTRRKVAAMSLGSAPLLVRKRTDSGSIAYNTAAPTIAAAPPEMNNDFHPNIGISQLANGPPTAVPSEYPIMITAT